MTDNTQADVRTWFHYPIEMPLTADGQGPATIGKDAAKITYEVWDQYTDSHGSFDCLPDAINEAMRLNTGATQPTDNTGLIEPVAWLYRHPRSYETIVVAKWDSFDAKHCRRHRWIGTPLIPAAALATKDAEIAALKAAKAWYETDAQRDLNRILPDMESKIAHAKTHYGHCIPDHLFSPLEASITELRVLRHELAAIEAKP